MKLGRIDDIYECEYVKNFYYDKIKLGLIYLLTGLWYNQVGLNCILHVMFLKSGVQNRFLAQTRLVKTDSARNRFERWESGLDLIGQGRAKTGPGLNLFSYFIFLII